MRAQVEIMQESILLVTYVYESSIEPGNQLLYSSEINISDLKALRRQLKSVVESCDRGVVEDCKILDALSPGRAGTSRNA